MFGITAYEEQEPSQKDLSNCNYRSNLVSRPRTGGDDVSGEITTYAMAGSSAAAPMVSAVVGFNCLEGVSKSNI